MAIRLKRAIPGRLVGGRFYPNPKGSGSEEALYRVFRKHGYSRSEARRLAKLNAPYFASNPAGRWVEAKGSPIKKIRFRTDGYADIIVVPGARNLSHRKSKKEFKAARAALGVQAGMSRKAAKKAARSAVYRGDTRKFGPSRTKFGPIRPYGKNPISAQKEKLYRKALAIDERFQKALEKKYGSRAGDMRYRTKELPAYLRRLGSAMQKATERYRAAS